MAGIKVVLLDLDGTLFRGKKPIPGAENALEQLRGSGIKIFFLTNASTHNRKSTTGKLADASIKAYENEVFTSAYMVADYIALNHPGKSVFCVSEGGIQDELRAKGIKVLEDENADVVAVGLDRHLTYQKLATAFKAISKGAIFIASNEDATIPVEGGFLPGAGAMVAALERSTGKKPIVLGKPNGYGVELLMRENRLKKAEVIVVGDRLETDVLMGRKNGIKSVLVLTGVTKKDGLEGLKENEKPDYVIESVAQLPKLLSKLA